MNLQKEYLKRNKINKCVLPVHEGAYAFKMNNSFIFAHTAIKPKSKYFCSDCKNFNYVVDFYQVSEVKLYPVTHIHCNADKNLIDFTGETFKCDVQLIQHKNTTEFEFTIWNAFTKSIKIEDKTNEMCLFAIKNPQSFFAFHHQVTTLTCGRILF